jgi:GNAT superfamily N-acetyltransferase
MRAAIRGLAARAHPAAHVAAWSSLPALYHRWAMTAGGERYCVAVRAGTIVGYAARRRAAVTAVFVRPALARRGVGAALLARVERDARAAGLSALRADAARAAVEFYAAQGFRVGRSLRVPLPGGLGLAARRVTKPLR